MKWISPAAFAAVAGFVLTAGSSAGGAPMDVRAVGGCATSTLSVWVEKPAGNGALGSRYYFIRFTNLGARTCMMHGVPGVSAVGLRGERLGPAAGRSLARGPARVPHGATASVLLKIAVPGAVNGCRPRLAAALRVYPPKQRASGIVSFPVEICPHGFMFVGEAVPSRELEIP